MILITGGAGFIGSALAQCLVDRMASDKVVVVDDLSTGRRENIPDHSFIEFIQCDVNDYSDISAVFASHKFYAVLHYAAVVGVERTLADPFAVFADIRGIDNVLKLCKNTGVRHIYYSSSSEVYGEPVEMPQKEESTPLNARLPYSVVKNMS